MGIMEGYFQDGKLQFRGPFDKKFGLHGNVKFFDAFGRVSRIETWIEGVKQKYD